MAIFDVERWIFQMFDRCACFDRDVNVVAVQDSSISLVLMRCLVLLGIRSSDFGILVLILCRLIMQANGSSFIDDLSHIVAGLFVFIELVSIVVEVLVCTIVLFRINVFRLNLVLEALVKQG